MSVAKENYISLLLVQCAKSGLSAPTFEYETSPNITPEFICKCTFQEWTTQGIGYSKKIAKQRACQLMSEKPEVQKLFEKSRKPVSPEISVINKLQEYCTAHKKGVPLFSDKDKDGDEFVVACTVDGFTALGKGRSKKLARENASNEVANHFKVNEFYENRRKLKEEKIRLKSPISRLLEICQATKLSCHFDETKEIGDSEKAFVVTCFVKDLVVKSSPHFCKKLAKIDVASQMIKLLESTAHLNTPNASPSQSHTQQLFSSTIPGTKRKTPVKDIGAINQEVDSASDNNTGHASSKQRKLFIEDAASDNDASQSASPSPVLKSFLSSDEENSAD